MIDDSFFVFYVLCVFVVYSVIDNLIMNKKIPVTNSCMLYLLISVVFISSMLVVVMHIMIIILIIFFCVFMIMFIIFDIYIVPIMNPIINGINTNSVVFIFSICVSVENVVIIML